MGDVQRDELLEASVNMIDDLSYVFTPDGEYLEWNDAFSSVTGYTDPEIEDLEPSDLVSSDDQERVSDAIEQVVMERTSVSVEANLLTKDGTQIPYEFTGAPLDMGDG